MHMLHLRLLLIVRGASVHVRVGAHSAVGYAQRCLRQDAQMLRQHDNNFQARATVPASAARHRSTRPAIPHVTDYFSPFPGLFLLRKVAQEANIDSTAASPRADASFDFLARERLRDRSKAPRPNREEKYDEGVEKGMEKRQRKGGRGGEAKIRSV